MDFFKPAALTASKRFQLEKDEVEYCSATGSVLDRNKSVLLPIGTVTLTSHHIFHVDSQYAKPMKLSLGEIKGHEVHNSVFRRTPRVDLFTTQSTEFPSIRIALNRDRVGDFDQHLQRSLSRKAWLHTATLEESAKQESHFSTRHAGIAGVMRRQKQGRDRSSVLTKEAFQDLDSLMVKAKGIVEIVERYSAALHNREREGENGNNETKEFDALLHNMGISNPVTKRASGSLYHTDLSRQVADFLSKDLVRHSKMKIVALTDLYAIVNRARGSEMISPDDLYQACNLFKPLGLGFHMYKFKSGVIVVQPDSFTPESISKRVLEAVKRRGSMSASEAAQDLSVSLAIAKEILVSAETMGVICRDDAPAQSMRYFENLFPVFHNQALKLQS